jgi:intracellular septation protein
MLAFLEYIPIIAFFIVYKTVDIYWASGALVAGTLLSMIITKLMGHKIKKSTLAIFFFALVMSTLTIIFRDEQFIKWKFTVLYFCFGSALVISRYALKKNLAKRAMQSIFTLPEFVWDRVNIAWAAFFIFCSGLNLYVAANWSLDSWVNFKVFGVMGMTFVYLLLTVFYVYRYLPDEDKE